MGAGFDQEAGFNLKYIAYAAIFFMALLLLIAAIHFNNSFFDECIYADPPEKCGDPTSWSDYRAAWGQFGDFFGGMLNPILSFFTICLLVNELRETRKAARRAELAHNATEKSLREQIELAQEQNKFSNYYKHIELFEQYVAGRPISQYKHVNKVKVRMLYTAIYPMTRTGNYKWDFSLAKMLLNQNNSILNLFSTFIDDGKADDLIYNASLLAGSYLQNSRSRVKFSVDLNEIKRSPVTLYRESNPDEKKEGFKLYNRDLREALLALIETNSVIGEALGFDPDCIGILDAAEITLKEIIVNMPNIASYSPITVDEHEWINFQYKMKNQLTAIKNTKDYLDNMLSYIKEVKPIKPL